MQNQSFAQRTSACHFWIQSADSGTAEFEQFLVILGFYSLLSLIKSLQHFAGFFA
jgi:hypothetical protein